MVDAKTAFAAGIGVTLGGLWYYKTKNPNSTIFKYLGGERRINSLQTGGTACDNLWLATSQVCGSPCLPCNCPQNPEAGFGFYGQGNMAQPTPTYTTPAQAIRRVPPHVPVR